MMKTGALLLLLAAACVPARAEAQAPVRAALVAQLRARLDRLHASRAAEPVRDGGDLSVSALVGMTRAELRRGLGEPHDCGGAEAAHDPQGRWVPTAPCEAPEDWFYSFYHFPPHSLGGGPELLLQF